MPHYRQHLATKYRRRRRRYRGEISPANTFSPRPAIRSIVHRDGPRSVLQPRLPRWGRNSIEVATAQANYCTDSIGDQSSIDVFYAQEHRHTGHGNSISDKEAAEQMEVELRLQRNWRADYLAGRILRNLIVRREALDDEALETLLDTADQVFFKNTLSGVSWRWSANDDPNFKTKLLGTTCISQDPQTGQSNLTIILSRPLLDCGGYGRELLLSTFLHELIHCYFFITCGLVHAEMCDGHTEGFTKIAKVIERWIGDDRLHLSNTRARLEDFQVTKSDAF